jgi:photosystem II stability/assembly factor-like uncharacterized protein
MKKATERRRTRTVVWTGVVLVASFVVFIQTQRSQLQRTTPVNNELPGLSAIVELSFVDSRNGWAVTPAAVLRTTDSGNTWNEERREPDSNGAIYHSVTFISQTTGWVVGSQISDGSVHPLIIQTVDSGKTWQKCKVNVPGGLRAVSFFNAAVGWAVGTNSIVHSSDGGNSWQQQFGTQSPRSLGGVASIGPDRAFAVGESGTVISTDDGGLNWRQHDLGTSANLFRVRFAAHDGWIVGTGGTVARTSNGGLTWQLFHLDHHLLLTDVYVPGLRGWIVGSNGAVLRTIDGGNSWKQQKAVTSEDLFCVSFIGPNLVWAGGDKRTVIRLE